MSVRVIDNFLPDTRKTDYIRRPVANVSGRGYTNRAHQSQPLSDILQPKPYVPKSQITLNPPEISFPVIPSEHKPNPGLWTQPKTRHMLPQTRLMYILPTIVFVLGGAFGLATIGANRQHIEQVQSKQSAAEKTETPASQAVASFGLPVRLKIPKINIDTGIDYVGLTPQGDMDTPKGPDNAGWYQHGPRPGEKGSSVIDGHFGYRDRIPAVFDNLHTLQKGDKIYVEDENGTTITFVAHELKSYGPNDDATDVFRSNDGKAHLNLITCQGAWNASQQSYSTRLVVFATKE